ncbi:MAG: threonine--tRNA ligase [Nitriliruptoraceae bacterium]
MTDSLRVRNADREVVLERGSSAIDALKTLEAVRGAIVAADVTVEGISRQWDLDRALPQADLVEIAPIAADSAAGLAILRHSTAHVMAQAVTDLYPEAKWAIGPPIQDGFYYDFDVDRPFTPEDLERIEARMDEVARERQRFVREEVSHEDALAEFADQPYKLQIIASVDDGSTLSSVDAPEDGTTLTIYRNVRPDGTVAWSDLCRGPHVPSTERIPAFRLLRSAGAYWRGREDQPMLQRIYGTAWESRKSQQAYLDMMAEARQRDHRKLGRELELVHFPEQLGPGLALFLPHGARVRKIMEDWIRDETLARGYEPVYTPHIAKDELWEISGHLENYSELMYPGMDLDDGASYRLKPMNCPFHILAFMSRTRSYRELPLRIAELGTVYRYERSGVVNGLLRARGFTQDDSHIFCRPDQVVDEVVDCIEFARDVYTAFGLGEPSRIAISTRPEKSHGTDEQWAVAEQAVIDAVERTGLAYETDPGEGAFYGPKIDIHAKDAIGREWQLTTVQVDLNLPERFDVTYIGDDGAKQRAVMVHRALFGSIERFFAVMVESFNGAFPVWMAPEQVRVVPVAADFVAYADEVRSTCVAAKLRASIDASDDTLGAKIRSAQTSKIPYTLIVGAQEQDTQTVAVRAYGGEQRKDVPVDAFVAELVAEAVAPTRRDR